MTKPTISVIMPVYNTERRVGLAIESILDQTFKDFEFIILDDGSTDRSYEICKNYAKKDNRIRLYKNEKNQGLSYTRNRLIGLATTDYIASQDSDDISVKSRLEIEYQFLSKNSKYSVVGGANEIIDEDGKNVGYRTYSDNILNIILKKSPISNPSSMYKKSDFYKVGGYTKHKELDGVEDYDLWLRFYLHGYGIKNLQKILLKYRIRTGQTKFNVKKILKNTIYIQKKYIKSGLRPTISDRIYLICEHILLVLPNSLIVFLFKKFTYKRH